LGLFAAHAARARFVDPRDAAADAGGPVGGAMPYTAIHGIRRRLMDQRTARVGKNNRAQVVTIPLEYRFPEGMKEVFIRKVGEEVILSPRPGDWSAFLASDLRASADFLVDVEDLPVQERGVG
jgi:antitoxin VapB